MGKLEIVASVLSVLLAIVGLSSAQSIQSTSYLQLEEITTMIFLPSALFSPSPTLQTFQGQISQSSGTTFYTLYDEENVTNIQNATLNFLPAQKYKQYNFNGYTFSACSTGTQYVLPDQNLTINCLSITSAKTAICTTTSLNLDDADLPSYTTLAESSTYLTTFYGANATAPSPRLTPTIRVGIGLGVPLLVCLCIVLALSIYRHREHKQLSRLKHRGIIVASAGQTPVGEETKLEPLVPYGEGASTTGFAARRDVAASEMGEDGDGAGGDRGIRASEMSASTNEWDGSCKAGRKELV